MPQTVEILSQFTLTPDRKTFQIYQWLKKNYRDCYLPDQRLLVECFQPPTENLLDFLVKTVDQIDISRCFIRVVTNQSCVLEYFSKNTGFEVVESLPVIQNKFTKLSSFKMNNVCAHAWAGFWLWPDGTSSVCCESPEKLVDQSGHVCNINRNTLEEIYQSPTLKKLRSSLSRGEKPMSCNSCWKKEAAGEDSRRTLAPYALGDVNGLIDWKSEDNFFYIGGHLGNLCNLSCRICNEDYSSTWAVENIKHSNKEIKKILQQNLKSRSWPIQNERFWDQLKSEARRIKAFEFLGGEPFMVQQNLDFFHWLIDQKLSHDSVFRFTTNGTKIPEPILEPSNYQRLEITFSIDDIGERFEYQRNGAKWREVERNIKKLCTVRDKSKNIKVGINTVISVLNIWYLPELLKWVDKSGADHWHYTILKNPRELSIDVLPKELAEMVNRHLSQSLQGSRDLNYLFESLTDCDGNHGTIGNFLSWNTQIDKRRSQDFKKIHPEMHQLIEDYVSLVPGTSPI